MTRFALLALPLFALAACSEPAPEPAPAEIAVPEEPSLDPADRETFTRVFAAECPDAEPVTEAICRASGIGSDDFICDFSTREDKYNAGEATLIAGDDDYSLENPETACTQGA